MASLPLFHRNRPRVLNHVNDNYCVKCATRLKDCAFVPGQLGLNPSPVMAKNRDFSSKSDTVNLLVNSCVADVHSVTGLPQKKGVIPNYCHNYTEIRYVKDVYCVGHLSSVNLVTNVPTATNKNAVEPVENQNSLGFYNWPFLVPKSNNRWRPILALRTLNTFLNRVIQNGDPRDNKTLPTGRGMGNLHRFQGRILPHTNSQSFTATSHQTCLQHTQTSVALCPELGWLVNKEKSELDPKQVFNFVGYQFDLAEGKVRPTPVRWTDKIQSILSGPVCPGWRKASATRSTITPTKTCSANFYRRIERRVGHSLK